ncbi:RHS repeat-associated core domain-containing protein [Flavobacterium columnare]|uniref:RHS repeat-associated core domain-containing protein n=1 Tax=Flavobacterium columnare TaxID=996 RepID=UPI003999AE70
MYGGLRNFSSPINLTPDFIPFRQLGQYEDPELEGLYYNRFRYYDCSIGNYISQDPIGLAGNNPTFYGYVHDSNSWVDPFGLMANFPTNITFAGSSDLYPVTGNQKNIVEIVMTGDRDADFTRAYKEAGISKQAMKGQGYTWHHVHDFDPTTGKTTMELVKTSAHEATLPHKGSASQFAEHFGVEYDTYESKMKAYEQGWRKKPRKCK